MSCILQITPNPPVLNLVNIHLAFAYLSSDYEEIEMIIGKVTQMVLVSNTKRLL